MSFVIGLCVAVGCYILLKWLTRNTSEEGVKVPIDDDGEISSLGIIDRARHAAYLSELAKIQIPRRQNKGTVLDTFAGCGGLSLGFEAAGFKVTGYEDEEVYAQTHRLNLNGDCHKVWLDTETIYPDGADVVMGGPPCQPYSGLGHQKGEQDPRDGFPAFKHCIEQTRPKIFIVENVRGVVYKNKDYFKAFCSELASLGYIVEVRLIKMVRHGIPQNRERVFAVGHKGGFEFPSESEIVFTAGDALGAWAFEAPADANYLTESMDTYVANYERKSKCVNPRDLHLDRPARTLTCRNLAAETSDMHRIALRDGSRRRLRVKEARRLQGFPDWFKFLGEEKDQFYQIGNAVPPLYSYKLALSVLEYLESYEGPITTEPQIVSDILA